MTETRQCEQCGGSTHPASVPTACRGLLPGDPEIVAMCERCLWVHTCSGPAHHETVDPASFTSALPQDADAAVAVGLLLTFLSSLALHRREIETVVEYLEAEGVDPLLVLDRLVTDAHVELAIDPGRRRDQLAQILQR